jgi:hypothetical protein
MDTLHLVKPGYKAVLRNIHDREILDDLEIILQPGNDAEEMASLTAYLRMKTVSEPPASAVCPLQHLRRPAEATPITAAMTTPSPLPMCRDVSGFQTDISGEN